MTLPIPTMRQVAVMVADEFQTPLGVMRSRSRMGVVARSRQVALYLFVTQLGKTLPEAGRFFDGLDHTTVLHAVRRIATLAETDAAFAERVQRLKGRIRADEVPTPSPPDQSPPAQPMTGEAPAPAPVVIAVPASVGRLSEAVEAYLKARKRLEDDSFSAHEAPSRRVEEQALSGLRVAYHDYLAGGRAS